ncbi:ribonuclease H-like domain-containing protein [Tanacetum coccineum]
MVTRAQVGIVKPNPRFHGLASSISPIPKSPSIALFDPHLSYAMLDEYTALIRNVTWILALNTPDVNVVRSMWLFRHKYHADGCLSRYKVHLFANGRSQQFGADCDETFSPVVKLSTIHTVLSLALSRGWPIHQLDVKNDFLTRIFPRLFICYALRAGISSSRCDSSLFIYRHGTEVAYLLIYVDDIILTASFTTLLHCVISYLHQEFDMTDLGALNYFLGISVTLDSSGIFLSQKKYAMELLEWAHMTNYNATRTPVDTESKLGSDGDLISDPTLYCSLQVVYNILHLLVRMSHMMCNRFYFLCMILENLTWQLSSVSYVMFKLHSPLQYATLVYCDNVSAIYLTVNPVQHQWTKHVEIDIHFVHDMVAHGQVRVLHAPSRYQYTNIFTKGLPSALFEEFRIS